MHKKVRFWVKVLRLFLTQTLITGVQIAFPKEGKALKHCLHFIWVFIMYYLEAFENLLLGLIFFPQNLPG